ncbi:MAG: FtsK/SpoIIIE domain-containing protein, partial [Chloroflexota bacterium]|nr:FtsK/SpoIIIE domain-containing protein [Chloroflexota bacterium]
MVASSKKGIRTPRAVARKPRPQPFFDAPLLLWIQQVPERIAVALPRFAGTPRFRRELLGVILIVIALLTAWVLGRGGDEGRLVAWWGETLVACCGRAAPLAPILVALAALRALSLQPGPILEIRHYLGGFGFGIAVVGLLQLGAGLNVPATGGYLGVAVATVALRFLGDLGAGLALFVIGVFAVFLLAGTDLQTFWDDLRALGRVFQRGLVALSVPIVRVVHAIRAIVIRRPTAGQSTTGENHPTPRDAASHAVASSTSSTVVINLPKQLRDQAAPPVVPEALPMKETARSRKLGATPPPDEIVPSPVVSARASMLPLPDLSKLNYYDGVTPDTADLHVKARRIEDTLSSFKVEARVREINPGPAVTQFALEPGLGIKVRRITELQNDLALALAAPSIRIEAPIPGLARVGLEIPNEQIATVGLRETLESLGFTRSKAKLPIPLGRDVNGRYVVGDLTRMPHLLIAGATGSGKSVCLNGIISTFLLTRSPDDLKLLMIDPKMVELTGYNGVPHLQCPVVTEMDKVVGALRLTLREMERRYTLFSRLGVRNLDGYRMKVADEPGAENLPY